ncbi:polyprotein [fipivirus A1]|uniref:Genome polyprotein n=1 Tax=fipivirus A1 TaxID=2116201 RepID=A0A2P1GN56_9PICO|nr:polyprotein [fipivirus A1]AVM87404.1 polyprotein [fipivirus A1]
MSMQKFGEGLDQTITGVTNMFAGLGVANEQNEEILLTPDRQTQLGAGAFLSVSQQSVSAQNTGSHQEQRTQASFDVPASLATQGERFFIVNSGTWTTSELRFEHISSTYLPSCFLNQRMSVFGHLAYHAYLRADFEVQIIINSTNFQQGALLLVAIPYEAAHDDAGAPAVRISERAALTLPHCLLNCNVNNTGAMRIPWLYTRNLKSIHQEARDPWVLQLLVWSPLTVATGTSTRVSFRILARMVNMELHGLRPYVPQMMRVSVEPGVGAINTSNSTSTVADQDMSLGPESFPFDATSAGGMWMKDMAKQIRTPCMLDVVTYSTIGQPAGTLLWQALVSPESESPTYHHVKHPTNLSALAQYFRYWRGDMIFTLQVMCTKFHSGRIMLSFVPEIKKPLKFEDHLSSSILLFDVNGVSSTADFRVPFMSDTMYRLTDAATGLLTLWVVNELTAPETVSHEVEMVLMVSGAESFQFYAPSWELTAQIKEGVAEADEGVTISSDGTVPAPDSTPISAASVVEDPTMLVSKTGTFPEVAPGKRTHTQSHVDMHNLMGRARLFQVLGITAVGADGYMFDIKFSTQNGPMRGLLRLAYMMRGPLRVVMVVEHGAQGQVSTCPWTMQVAYFPSPAPSSPITDDKIAAVGSVTITNNQTSTLKLLIPWYTNLTSVNVWGGPDMTFGHLYLKWFTSVSIRVRLYIAFDDTTQMLFPMPVQVLQGYTFGYSRQKLHTSVQALFKHDEDDVYGTEDETDSEDEGEDPGKQVREAASSSDEFRAQGGFEEMEGEMFPVGSLIRQPIACTLKLLWHYAVYVGGLSLIELVPEQDKFALWMTETSGKVRLAGCYEHDNWELVDVSPDPEITIRSAFSSIGRSGYSVLGLNCEVFARSCCMLGQEGQAEKFVKMATVGSAGALVASTVCMDWVPHAGKQQIKPEVPVKSWKDKLRLKSPAQQFARQLSQSLDETEMAQETKKFMSEATEAVQIGKTQVEELVGAVKEKLTPENLFSGVSKKRWLKMGAKATSVVLDLIAVSCEIAALVRTKEPETRNLLLGAMASRFGSQLMKFANTVMVIMDENMLPQGSVFHEELDTPEVREMFGMMVDSIWTQKMPEEFQPQGGVMSLMRDCSTASFALKSMSGFIAFMRQLFRKVVQWLNPKHILAQKWKMLGSMSKHVTEVAAEAARLAMKRTDSQKQKKDVCAKAEALHERILVLLDACSEDDTRGCLALVNALTRVEVRVAKIIIDNRTDSEAMRTEPVCCYLAGKPGSGKSISANALAVSLCNRLGLDPDTDIYSKPVGADYWDGYAKQQIMIIDDIGQNSDGEDWKDFCQIVSAATVRLNMAALTDKGATFKTPYIIMTSNQMIPKPNTVSTMAAIHRRLTYTILVEPHKSFEKASNPGQLDLQLAQASASLKGLQCCKYTPYMLGTNRAGGMDSVESEPVTFTKMAVDFYESFIEKKATTGKLKLMMNEIFAQGGGEEIEVVAQQKNGPALMRLTSVENENYNSGEWKELEVLACEYEDSVKKNRRKKKWMKRVLIGVSICGSVVGILGLVGGIVALSVDAQKRKMTPERAYAPGVSDSVINKIDDSLRAQRHAETSDVVRKNMVQIGWSKGEKRFLSGHGVFVTPSIMVCVTHCLAGDTLILSCEEDIVELKKEEYETKSLGGDLTAVMINTTRVRKRRNIVGSFMDEAELTRAYTGYAVGYTAAPTSRIMPFTNLRPTGSVDYPDPQDKTKRIELPNAVKALGVGESGLCGMPWISSVISTGCRIIGLHVAGSDSHSICQPIMREQLEELSALYPQCKIMCVQPAPMKVVTSGKSKIEPTVFHGWLPETKHPAALGPWTKGVINDPEVQLVVKHRAPIRPVPKNWHVAEAVAVVMGDELKTQVCQSYMPVLTMSQVVMGIPGLEGVDMKTSAGLPWSQLPQKERHKAKLLANPNFLDRVEHIVEYMTNPFVPMPVPEIYYSVHAKDETLSIDKAKMGRTRWIAAAPFHLVCAARRVFGRAVAAIHLTSPTTMKAYGIAVGMDPEKEWTQLALAKPGWPVIALDYSNFDGSLQSHVLTSACVLLGNLCGFPDGVGYRLAEFVAYSKQIVGDRMYTINGALPSGAPFTSILGSMCNFLMLLYTLSRATGQRMSAFQEWCHLCTYGDDVLVFVHPEVVVNADALAHEMYEVHGVTCTDATDKRLPPQLRELQNVTFLKRGFRRCQSCPFLTHPVMDKDTVWGMLTWKKKGSTYAELMRCAVSFMWHHGKEEYERFVGVMENHIGLIPVDQRSAAYNELCSYEELHDHWMNHKA